MGKVNEKTLDWSPLDEGRTFFKRKQLGDAADGDELGCSLYEIPPGRRSWPYHSHMGNEEAAFVLSGAGTLRLDGETAPLTEGDYVAFPAEERGAHRIINDSDESAHLLDDFDAVRTGRGRVPRLREVRRVCWFTAGRT